MSLEKNYSSILEQLGEDVAREGLRDTPKRAAKAMQFLCRGYEQTLEEVTNGALFSSDNSEMVLVKNVELYSLCEHHMLPFMGTAHIGYLPNGRVVGLSKLARVVEVVSKRPQVQERMTETIADLLVQELDAKGVAVVVEATHTCMTIRGIRKPGSLCVTSAMRGIFRSHLSSRSEIMTLIYGGRRG